MNTITKDTQFIAPTYTRADVVFICGKGSRLWDESRREYLDFSSGIGVNSFGSADPEWLAAVTAQAGGLAHISNLYYTEPCADLAELLCKKTGMAKVFFANSGAEANECAIKAARKYGQRLGGAPDGVTCNTIVTLNNSFHGRTLATLAATGQPEYHKHFHPFPSGFISVPANDIDALCSAFDAYPTCAFMFECVQGEGGVNTLSALYLQDAQQLCSERDILLICDEVQTGNGRTGTLYSYEQFGISPDIVTTANGLGGGLPIGAVLFSEKTAGVLTPGTHGSTFGGNPVCCAGALSILRRLDEDFLASVRAKSEYLRTALAGMPCVTGLSGLGLMIGVSVACNAKAAAQKCLSAGLVILTAKDKLRLLPPLNTPQSDLDAGLAILREVLGAC
ncbi:MAG: aspartate aminotransferase family protein [Oscillospiraceae bacterium]|jgi:acetylornithine/N-succinyldiaminopimelate aminotransferase|nr:aspartate aminotransferase family protein [Oscillospiraceae bacterium]